MEIIKELNLNGNPQTVPNGSLVYAKNLKLSVDGTYITNDEGFSECFDTSEDSDELRSKLKVSNIVGVKESSIFIDMYDYTEEIEGETIALTREYMSQKIAGHINCPNEIVFFVYKTYDDRLQGSSEVYRSGEEHIIYRAVEFKDSNKFALFKVPTAWHYDGGDITGTYTYNVYGHLIVAIAEYNADIDKQLLTIDLNDSNYYDDLNKYSCAPNIPIANLSLNGKVKGNAMAHGLYYFFIRYEISDKLYTNWFPIGAPQYALSLDYKTLFNHTYATDNGGTNTAITSGSFLVNTDKDSYYNLDFTITFDNTFSYIGFQIGYILQTEDTAVGRIWNGFEFSKNEISKSFLFNGGYIEEVSIEDLTRNVLNIYNVKTVTNYNSKLYAANFKETEYNVDLQEKAKKIDTYLIKKVVDTDIINKGSTLMVQWTYTINGSFCTITVPSDVTSVKLTDFNNLLVALNGNIDWYYGQEENVLFQLGNNTRVVLSTEGLSLEPSLPGDDLFWIFKGDYAFGNHPYGGPGGSGIFPNGTLESSYVKITREEIMSNYSTYNVDNIVRTLMPYEVYAFYVHYVRPDGSYTNGIPLENKVNYGDAFEAKLRTKISDLSAQDLDDFHLTDIATIDEIKDRYLYELYIPSHIYAKECFGLYLDNKGKRLFRTDSGILHVAEGGQDKTYLLRLGVRFENIEYPEGYVGAFFSYEKINSLSVYQGYVSDTLSNTSSVLLKANDVESANCRYDGALFIPHHKINGNVIESIASEPYYGYINNALPVLANSSVNFEGAVINRRGIHGGIVMNISEKDNTLYQPSIGIIGSIVLFNRSIYSNEVKELIPFGPITNTDVYGEITNADAGVTDIDVDDTIVNYDINYPSFLVQDKILTYKNNIFINEAGSVNLITDNIVDSTSYYTQSDYANETYVWKFSNLNLLALSLKKEPEDISGVVGSNKNTINTVVKPINSSDLFKLESCYIPQIHKAYTSYNKYIESPNTFTNVVRCSYPIRNESGINSWRVFDPVKYHIIDNSNGEIINIFGAGTSFFIHTKNNILVTSSDAKISANNTTIHLQENNIFDVPPSEIFSSELGYGGLKHQNCQLFSQFGYIWYDTDRRKLFRYDNGRLIDINTGIEEIIRRYKYEYCCINIDNSSNRIFFCFYNDIYNPKDNKITVAYDTLNNKWLSCYDFLYDMSIHTANVILFSEKQDYYIYTYDSSAKPCNYDSLEYVNEDFPSYIPLGNDGIKYFCFDVIFNNGYTIPKVLDSITWAHEVIEQHILDSNHPAQLKLEYETIKNRIHDIDGVSIIAYSDSVDSGIIDLECEKLNDVANPNNPNAYKYPYYNKGVWNHSYFRNAITTPITDEELNALAAIYGDSTVTKLKKVYKAIDRNNVPIYRPSDMRTLIYGKYIVIRFIFKTDKIIKFDNLEFNLQKY